MTFTESNHSASQNALHQNNDGKFLTFSLDREDYGIDILQVREIIGLMPITGIPQSPDYMRGVVNLRGKVVPVIDLRQKFDLNQGDNTQRTCIIVVEINHGQSKKMVVGLVVDSVSEVLYIKEENIEPPPNLGVANFNDTDHIMGMAKLAGKVKILLNIDYILGTAEVEPLISSIQ
ncbi:chemotaxis protein CheW [Desulfurivibrio dismutans]|uniref:chemotaxis protein CheW n=1 Tax=Desulfurivibrio dismutans TaxID=1398908 RepID=UPI0023DA4728|nr:chemotaxis protein CheW [Desulfurivibrio alkaliphilus]MDF1615521.1 chemotaxis protein CheW [Desulfurivibrio alkaliphilus]